jgi:nickel-dependent lactate racemase
MDFELGYGKTTVRVSVPKKNLQAVLLPNDIEVSQSEQEIVGQSLQNPIASKRLRDIVKKGQTVSIVTSDITRPMPSYKVLPQVLDELRAGGVEDKDITVVLALGSHRGHSEEEKRALIGSEVFDRVLCIDSDMDHCMTLGTTAQGTPADIFVPVAKADVRVLLGNIEYHYFVGYSGGAKALMPGVSSRRAIEHNHRNMVLPEACAGRIDGNPVREDIESILGFISADFIVNVVQDEHKRIVRCVSGDVIKAHRVGCAYLDSLYAIPIDAPADVVIVSQGGAPKDLNVYQSQKALDNARQAVRQGGTILWVGRCQEGYGEGVFEKWLNAYTDPDTCVCEIQKHFELGGHKAAAIALTAQRARILLFSDLSVEMTRKAYCEKAESVQSALDEVLAQNPAAKVIVMPYGGSTLPKCP